MTHAQRKISIKEKCRREILFCGVRDSLCPSQTPRLQSPIPRSLYLWLNHASCVPAEGRMVSPSPADTPSFPYTIHSTTAITPERTHTHLKHLRRWQKMSKTLKCRDLYYQTVLNTIYIVQYCNFRYSFIASDVLSNS